MYKMLEAENLDAVVGGEGGGEEGGVKEVPSSPCVLLESVFLEMGEEEAALDTISLCVFPQSLHF